MRLRHAGLAFTTTALATSLSAGSALSEFQAADWTLVTTLVDVPATVREALAARFGGDGRIAEHGGEFEATDVVSGVPSKRFVLGGQDDTLWFIAFEQGGYAHHLVLAVVRVDADAALVTLVARGTAGQHEDSPGGWSVTLNELRDALADGSLRLEYMSGASE